MSMRDQFNGHDHGADGPDMVVMSPENYNRLLDLPDDTPIPDHVRRDEFGNVILTRGPK